MIEQDFVLHWGCRNKPGHYLTYPNGQFAEGDCDRLRVPRPSSLDDGLFLPRPEKVGEGALTYLPAADKTVLAWWDRTFDKRGACNMAIIVPGRHSADEVWAKFKGRFADLEPKLKQPNIVASYDWGGSP